MQPCPDQALGAPSRVTAGYNRTIASEHCLDRLWLAQPPVFWKQRFLRCEIYLCSAPCRWLLLDAFVFATVRLALASCRHKKLGLELYPHGEETRALTRIANCSYRQSDASLRIVPGLISLATRGTARLDKQLNLKADGIGKRVQPAQAARLINRFATRNAIQPLHYA